MSKESDQNYDTSKASILTIEVELLMQDIDFSLVPDWNFFIISAVETNGETSGLTYICTI